MILYRLKCSFEHEFEAWFRNGASYEKQRKRGDVDCPICGDTHVAKAPMAPSIGKGSSISEESAEKRAREVAEQILQTAHKIRETVEENCEYVGDEFADEAKRIHNGDADERGIYGEATDDQAADLDEEGIEYHRILGTSRRSRRNN
ncbi:MAG: DUF1178 family protein [Rhodospirillaceae bacterium]|nr:DUF1178 family protein [Rhodospirillaceae bacterium]